MALHGGGVGVGSTRLPTALPRDWGSNHDPLWLSILQNLSLLAFLLIPISIGVAILRYRLYDIDRIISRTVSYFLLTALLVGDYALIVVGIGTLTGRSENPVLIAGATLLVAALFRPLRRRLQTASTAGCIGAGTTPSGSWGRSPRCCGTRSTSARCPRNSGRP